MFACNLVDFLLLWLSNTVSLWIWFSICNEKKWKISHDFLDLQWIVPICAISLSNFTKRTENREEHCFLTLDNKNVGWTDLQENYSFFTYSQPTMYTVKWKWHHHHRRHVYQIVMNTVCMNQHYHKLINENLAVAIDVIGSTKHIASSPLVLIRQLDLSHLLIAYRLIFRRQHQEP